MSSFQRIGSYNLAILLVAAGVLRLFIREEYEFGISGYGALLAAVVLGQAFINLLAAVAAGTASRRWAFLLNALLVLLIGLGVCAIGVASIPRSRQLPVFHRQHPRPLPNPARAGTSGSYT